MTRMMWKHPAVEEPFFMCEDYYEQGYVPFSMGWGSDFIRDELSKYSRDEVYGYIFIPIKDVKIFPETERKFHRGR